MSAGGVAAAQPAIQLAGSGATPTPALHLLKVKPVPMPLARKLIERNHYLHSLPAGTRLCFGVFLDSRLMGAITIGVGPFNAHRLVAGASPSDCATLTRLWLSDELPRNSESRVIGILLCNLRSHTDLKFLLSYADPAQGHMGTIYQATNWLYTGPSEAMPLYDVGDGKAYHSRSLSHAYGTHSLKHFANQGVEVRLVPQSAKHRYIYFLDPSWRPKLRVSVLPYPKKEATHEGD